MVLMAAQRQEYLERGWVVIPSVFTSAECTQLVKHQMALHSGAAILQPDERYGEYGKFRHCEGDGWGRIANQHLIDKVWRHWVADSRLTAPLTELLGDGVQAVHSVYFYKSSTSTTDDHNFHADQTPLPGCVSAWVALTDTSETNGPLLVQVGSHRGRCVWHDTVIAANGETDTAKRKTLEAEIFEENRRDGMPCRSIPVSAGSVILFDGRLLHSGEAPLDPSAFRHSLVCRYIPRSFGFWPPLWVTRAPDAASRRLSHPRIDVPGAVSTRLLPEERRAGAWVGRGWQLPLSERDRREILQPFGGRLIVRSVFSPQECDALPNHCHEAALDQRVRQLAADGCEPGTGPLLLSSEVVCPAGAAEEEKAAVALWVALGDDGSRVETSVCRQGDCVLARGPAVPDELLLCPTALRLCFAQRPRESSSTPNL